MSKTIAAVATGNSVSGIGVIRISGDNAIEIAEKVFKAMDSTPLSSLKGYTAKFGNVYSKGEKFDKLKVKACYGQDSLPRAYRPLSQEDCLNIYKMCL